MSGDAELLAAIAHDARLLVLAVQQLESARQDIETISDRVMCRFNRLSTTFPAEEEE